MMTLGVSGHRQRLHVSPLGRMFTSGLQFDRVEKRWRRLVVHNPRVFVCAVTRLTVGRS